MKIQQHELLSCIIRETTKTDTFIKIAEAVGLKVTLIDDSEDIDEKLILKNAIKRLEKLNNKIVM